MNRSPGWQCIGDDCLRDDGFVCADDECMAELGLYEGPMRNPVVADQAFGGDQPEK